MAKTSGKLFLSINDITVLLRDSIHETIVPLSIPEVWLRLHGIPKKHRRVDRLMEGLKMLGRPIVVDELSIIWVGPVRMKFGCRAPDKMNGFVQVWFNHEGYQVKVEVERPRQRGGVGSAGGGGSEGGGGSAGGGGGSQGGGGSAGGGGSEGGGGSAGGGGGSSLATSPAAGGC